jgi:hypothetical protein
VASAQSQLVDGHRIGITSILAKGPPIIPIPFTMMPTPLDSQIQIGFDFGSKEDAALAINES